MIMLVLAGRAAGGDYVHARHRGVRRRPVAPGRGAPARDGGGRRRPGHDGLHRRDERVRPQRPGYYWVIIIIIIIIIISTCAR